MRARILVAIGSFLFLLLAACSDADDGAGGAPSPTRSETESPASESPSESPTSEPSPADDSDDSDDDSGSSRSTEVEAEDSSLGTILTDSDGNTLYVFFADTDGDSTCYDDCAENWPALRARGELEAGDGVDASLLGTTERTDGVLQVTYAGQPLYFFAGDQQPGDTNGQGVGDVWFVVAPDGTPVQR
jgi:predicted lipoprotein with Yx(FWY)xxD motif